MKASLTLALALAAGGLALGATTAGAMPSSGFVLAPSAAGIVLASHGKDDPKGHDAGDDHGRHRGGHAATGTDGDAAPVLLARRGRGADDPKGHDAGDDRGGRGKGKGGRGADDGVGHDKGDDRGRDA